MDILGSILQEYRSYLVLVYGILIGSGLLWQRHLLREKDPHNYASARRLFPGFVASAIPYRIPKRAVVPYVFGMIVVLGTLAFSSFELIEHGIEPGDWWGNLFKALSLAMVLVAKAWLGPLVMSVSVAYSIHLLSLGADLEWIPLLQGLLDWVFKGLPDALYLVYSFFSLFYITVTSLGDSLSQ